MKRNAFALTTCFLAAALWSCGDNKSTTTESDTTTTSNTGVPADTTNTTSTTPTINTTPVNTTPLSKDDSTFVMKAAMGGMMEVEGGNMAQQNGANDRVKNFGAMMVRDHSQVNNELKSLVSGRITLPDSLSKDKRSHLTMMGKMTGKSFDSHYMSMMVSDHKKDVGEFQSASKKLQDSTLKNWATKTLPILQMHLDSAQAISKGIK